MSASWNKIAGTQLGKFTLGFTGVTLKDNSGNLVVRNSSDSNYTDVVSNKLVLDNNSGGSVTIQGAVSTNSIMLTLPSTVGTSGQVLSTDGAGNLSWTDKSNSSIAALCPDVSTLSNAASPINTVDKVAGKLVVVTDASNRALYCASGSNPTDAWLNVTGQTSITPT